MIGLLIASLAVLALAHPAKKPEPRQLPCYPDTVTVIEQQVLGPDTTMSLLGMPVITYRVILCNPTPGSLK